MNRRSLLRSIAGTMLSMNGIVRSETIHTRRARELPPVRTITTGPRFHWFGYYDKLQFDPTNRFVLSNQVKFEHRTPKPDDVIRVGMVDTAEHDKWIELGSSRAWGWQQGCMLQWVPRTQGTILWNDRQGERYVSHVLNVHTQRKKTLSHPIYTLANSGEFGLTADFARIQVMRPGYGYVGLPDENEHDVAPADSGVFRVDLKTGRSELVLSLADVAKIPYRGERLSGVKHYFNHLLISPDSRRFIVLHRWRKYDGKSGKTSGGFITRMLTADIDGRRLYVLDPSGYTSHFIWRDDEHVCMWTRPKGKQAGFYLFRDRTRQVEPVGQGIMTSNGHNTYLPLGNRDWILNDTYPDQQRNQHPYLFHVPTNRKFDLGHFRSPKMYSGEWRCDTHPRSSNDGKTVCIDSPHLGNGRQLHLIDVSEIVENG